MRNPIYYKNYLQRIFVKRMLQKSPELYIKIQRFRYRNKRSKRKIVNENTDIVIEGYPRSANSFSVNAFRFANGEDYSIATHLHVFPQVIVGVRYNIPTLVLIRNPFDAVISYASLSTQKIGLEAFRKQNDLIWLLEDYIFFYTNLLPVKDKIVIGVFTDVLKDYGTVIKNINEKFGSDFIPFEHTKENVTTVFETAKSHLSPSDDRDNIKKSFQDEMETLRSNEIYKRAEKLYTLWTSN